MDAYTLVAYLKALHIIFVVSWFSALFFLGRIFIYHKEALEKKEDANTYLMDLLKLSEKRTVYIILWPSILLSLVIGTVLIVKTGAYRQGWFHFKLLLLLLFFAYNIYYLGLRKKLEMGTCKLSGLKLRFLNEVPFFFLVGIVFAVYMKNLFSGIWALIVLLLVVILTTALVRMYKKKKRTL